MTDFTANSDYNTIEEQEEAIAQQEASIEARLIAMDTLLTALESTIDNNTTNNDFEDEFTWNIDRTPDYDILFSTTILIDIVHDLKPTISFSKPINIIIQELSVTEEEHTCCVCMDKREKFEICNLDCNHKFCYKCIQRLLIKNIYMCCPLCRNYVKNITTQTIQIQEIFNEICM